MTPVVDLALVGVGSLAGLVLLDDLATLPAGPPTTTSVSVIIPARNEAERLPRLLDCLAADRRSSASLGTLEVIVVDDGSSDGTGDLAAAAGARVLRVEPPAGWTGKAWACWQGASRATGEVLVFLDADTEPGPGAVAALAAAAERAGGLVSVQPQHRVERAYESLSAACNLVAVFGAGTGRAGRPRWWRAPIAYGPAMAIPRAAYLGAGGHAAVRDEVAEDLALARHLDGLGLPVEAWISEDISYRMYPEGPASLVEGWTKNLAVGAGRTPLLRLALVTLWIASVLVAARLALTSPVGMVALAAVAVEAAVLLRRVGRFPLAAAACVPLLVGAFIALLGVSVSRRTLRRPNVWRGRVLPQRSR